MSEAPVSTKPPKPPMPVWEQPNPDPYAIPLASIDMSNPLLYENELWHAYFKRLRKEDPVHFNDSPWFGPIWSVTKFDDIMYVDTHHDIFSSETGITIDDEDPDFTLPMFIAMDPPKHDDQRKVVQPVVAPLNLAKLEGLIRERMQRILDSLPVGQTFDWVDRVSIELTTQMLATLFDFPFEERRKLTYWSDLITGDGVERTEEEQQGELLQCLAYFQNLWHERVNKPSGNDLDLISMLAHGEATKNMAPMEFLGNLILLIVGGNDTTRNSISGGVIALNKFPKEYQKLRDNPALIPNMVSEIIRFQTPLLHMRRRAKVDTTLGGKQIKAGQKVLMWYVSGNRDEDAIDRPDEFIIDRPQARHHVSFGFGIHRCMGNRLAEMQLRIVWEEVLKRFRFVEVVGEPVRLRSNFVRGIRKLPVVLHPH